MGEEERGRVGENPLPGGVRGGLKMLQEVSCILKS